MKPEAGKTKAEQICTYLLNEISCEKIKRGERLLSERDLSAKLGVSRMPLREALRALCNMGVLVTKRGGGTYVMQKTKNSNFFLEFNMKEVAVLEVLQARTVIETEAARLAAIEATEEEIETICKSKDVREAEIQKQLSSEPSENDAMHTADTNFHRAIVQASHNSVFISFLESVMETLSIHQRQASFKPDMFWRTSLYHQKIYEAIARHDPSEASKMMKLHIEDVGAAIKQVHNNNDAAKNRQKNKDCV